MSTIELSGLEKSKVHKYSNPMMGNGYEEM